MYTTTTIVLIATFVLVVDACNRRKPPPPPPPPDAPPNPPAPPPIVSVVRDQEQQVGFNKCYRKCDAKEIPMDSYGNPLDLDYASICEGGYQPVAGGLTEGFNPYSADPFKQTEDVNSGADGAGNPRPPSSTDQRGNPCGAATKCVYECQFKVYSEVALTTISKRTGCGCAFHINTVKPRPSKLLASNINSAHVADKIEISDFELVVWNYKSNLVVERIPEFKLEKSETTKAAIERQVQAQNTADFTTVLAGFSGEVSSFPKLPKSLDLNDPKNENHVPALSFTVTQTYEDSKIWDAPSKPQMANMPNAFQSQCIPFFAHDPFCYNSKKRQLAEGCDGKRTEYFMKKFFLFPKDGIVGEGQGNTYAPRMLTSFYTTDTCHHNSGILTIDSEFTHELKSKSDTTSLALGTWLWERTFADGNSMATFGTQYVLGVPARFSTLAQVWDKKFSKIEWYFPSGHVADGTTTIETLAVKAGICKTFSPTKQPVSNDKYGETGRFYAAEAGINCGPFDDVARPTTANANCGTEAAPDVSLLAFLNEGEILNFNKLPLSTMIIGRQEAGCKVSQYEEVVFDSLTFTGCPPGRHPHSVIANKRSLHADQPHLGLVYDEELEGFVHFLHPRGHIAMRPAHKRSLADTLENQVATPPNEENFDMRFATGSVAVDGSDSANAGDHPLELFPETFSAPVNIDPQVDSDDIVEALVTTGTELPACHRGSIGCSCRVSGALECDLGLTCGDDKCLPENCLPGQPGCACKGGQCDGENTECFKDDEVEFCRTKSSCVAGTAGCGCDSKLECAGAATCAEGQCMLLEGCTVGEPGCSCTEDLKCADSNMQCDPLAMACLAPRCSHGEPGCRCKDDGSCKTGFQCNQKLGVCALFECPLGFPGCQCLADNSCSKPGFECQAYTTTGDSRCVAEPHANCFPQNDRCVEKCGSGNVAICPPCTNGMILCHVSVDQRSICDIDPFRADCASAASVFMSLAAAVIAMVALF